MLNRDVAKDLDKKPTVKTDCVERIPVVTQLFSDSTTNKARVLRTHSIHLFELLNTDDLVKVDAIAKAVVSNLRAGDNAISVIKLNPPYNLMVDLVKTTENLSWSG